MSVLEIPFQQEVVLKKVFHGNRSQLICSAMKRSRYSLEKFEEQFHYQYYHENTNFFQHYFHLRAIMIFYTFYNKLKEQGGRRTDRST